MWKMNRNEAFVRDLLHKNKAEDVKRNKKHWEALTPGAFMCDLLHKNDQTWSQTCESEATARDVLHKWERREKRFSFRLFLLNLASLSRSHSFSLHMFFLLPCWLLFLLISFFPHSAFFLTTLSLHMSFDILSLGISLSLLKTLSFDIFFPGLERSGDVGTNRDRFVISRLLAPRTLVAGQYTLPTWVQVAEHSSSAKNPCACPSLSRMFGMSSSSKRPSPFQSTMKGLRCTEFWRMWWKGFLSSSTETSLPSTCSK